MPARDWVRLRRLPWGAPLDEWREHGIQPLTVRRGESRHPVLFVELDHQRYALKETSPRAARHEVAVFEELVRRGCRTLEPVGFVAVRGEAIAVGELGGRTVYESGDVGYCVTRLAERVLPQSVLYRYPFTDANKRLLWSAVAELLLDLHEGGVYWGDPSLANVLMDLGDQRLTAVMADGETAELVSGPLNEGMRQQDIDSFAESLAWQAEDIRVARGLPEDQRLVTDGDIAYFVGRYAGLRAERMRARHSNGGNTLTQALDRALDLQQQMRQLNALGYGILQFVRQGTRAAAHAEWRAATLRPGWYVRRLRELLGVVVPTPYARRLYQHLLVHKWLLSEQADRDVGIEAAAQSWLTEYHQPMLAFIASYLPHANVGTIYSTYVAILDHTWEMSRRERRAVPLEEGAVDFVLAQAPPSPLAPDPTSRE